MKINLSQTQRIFVAIIYLFILAAIFNFIGGNFRQLISDTNFDSSILFYAGALMIIFGVYIVEPYFTKPSDAIANSVAILIALLGLTNKESLFAYNFIFYYSIAILSLSILTILLKDVRNRFLHKTSRVMYWFVENFGKSQVIFSIIYLSAAYSYFAIEGRMISFIAIIAFWTCLTFFDVVGVIIEKIAKLISYFQNKAGEELGQAIGCDNPLLYKVEIDYSKHKQQNIKYGDIVAIETSLNVGSIGMVINSKYLLNKKWLVIYLLKDEKDEILKINLKNRKLATDGKSIFTKDNCAYFIGEEDIHKEVKGKIDSNQLYKNRAQFIGYVTSGSNINTINFIILRDIEKIEHQISEGIILKTRIYNEETLYQVINGNTKEEHLENFDSHGYIIGIARKLGRYKKIDKELDSSKWMPSIYAPLFFAFTGDIKEERIKEIANSSIGRLPGTDLEIPIKDPDAIVTHNTAILGILGIGKSCLAYDLIKKIAEKNIKIICLDITNEYNSEKGLWSYINKDDISFEIMNLKIEELKKFKNDPTKLIEGNPQASGNINDYINVLDEDLKSFFDSDDKIKIYNPDWHPVSKGQAYKNTSLEDLTVAEKTRVISERVFLHAMNTGQSNEAKYLLVFEEAHSLVPEWTSVANEGDKSATNGTAKVILQGRKYGLGSLVITQRTANVSKSILNQCNTIFALRIFDDTGKNFLENYIGGDYANTLPTLEERHAIAIGKGLKLKQPVIVQLNDKDYVQLEEKEK